MATKREETDLPELLVKVEEDLQVSQNGVKAIETLQNGVKAIETLQTLKSVQNNPRFKVLLDNSVKLISEEQQTLEVILTIGTLYYNQSDDKTSLKWLLKYLTKIKLGSESGKNIISYATEFMLGCCYYNLSNDKMAYKCLKRCPPDPTNVSTYLQHCYMLIHSCQALELHNEMLKYQLLSDENPSGTLNVNVRIYNAEMLFQSGKIAGAKQHLKEASNILCNCQDKQIWWLLIARIYTDLKMYCEACQCNQKFVDSFKDQRLDPPPDILLKVLIKLAHTELQIEQYQTAISICQHFLELVQKALNYDKHVVLYTMAESYYYLKDYGSAIKYFERSLEEMKRVRASSDYLDYCHLSRVWLRISRSQLLSGSYQMALKSAKKSVKYLKSAPGKFPNDDMDTATQLSYCWRKLGHPQKAKMFMCSSMEQLAKKEEKFVDFNSKHHQQRLIYMAVCEHLLSGTFAIADNMFKSILLEEAEQSNNSLEEVMKILHFCFKSASAVRNRSAFPEDGQLFWSRIDHICCNEADDGYFLSHLPIGFKKRFFQYKNSLEGCNHLFKQFN
jgi:tetratricopeptide (TPR) repeat protein